MKRSSSEHITDSLRLSRYIKQLSIKESHPKEQKKTKELKQKTKKPTDKYMYISRENLEIESQPFKK